MNLDINPKQMAFVAAYTSGPTIGNAAASAMASGYSALTADDLLENPGVRKAIDDILAEAAAAAAITKARVMAELGRIAFTTIREIITWWQVVEETGELDGEGVPETRTRTELALTPWAEMNPSAAAAIAEIRQTKDGLSVKMHGKAAALAELGRHLGIATKLAHTGPDGTGPVETITREMTPEQAAEYYRRTLNEG